MKTNARSWALAATLGASITLSACGSNHHDSSAPNISVSTSTKASAPDSHTGSNAPRTSDSPSVTKDGSSTNATNDAKTSSSSDKTGSSSQNVKKTGHPGGSYDKQGRYVGEGAGEYTKSGTYVGKATGTYATEAAKAAATRAREGGAQIYEAGGATSDGSTSDGASQATPGKYGSHESSTTIKSRSSSNVSIARSATKSAKASTVPVSISIPSIGVNHSITIGYSSATTIAPQAGTIESFLGYGRVLPGQPGTSVLLGHVTYYGPDVFYRLNQLSNGSRFSITYADGSTKNFVVTGKQSIDKDSLTNNQRLWGNGGGTTVALVSCDKYSAWQGRHHENNFIVWASPV